MNIGEVAKITGVSRKTIRYYESIDLLKNVARNDNGYREYTQTDIDNIAFVKKSRELGFSINECYNLISLYACDTTKSRDVRELASKHLQNIEIKIDDLTKIRDKLKKLVDDCPGDNSSDCPILQQLSS